MDISDKTLQESENLIDSLPLDKLPIEYMKQITEDANTFWIQSKENLKSFLYEDYDFVLGFIKELGIPIEVTQDECDKCNADDIVMVADKPDYTFKCPYCGHVNYEI